MWLKTLGLILVIASCSGIGAEAVHRLRERLRLLETLRRMASHMKGEILYANVPLAEALYRTGKRNKGAAGELFIAIATELEQETGESFEAVWRAKAGKFAAGSVLNKKEQEQLLRFGQSLGYLDRDMQEKAILFYLEDLEHSIETLRKEEPEKSRLFFGMGILSGLFLAVVLI